MTTPTPVSVPDALYHRDGHGFVATAATQSAWDAGAQNGGAILGLLGRCFEDIPTLVPMLPSRMTFDMIRPAPIGPRLDVASRVLREGKRIQLVEVVLTVDGVEHVRGQSLRLRVEDISGRPRLPASTTGDDPASLLPDPGALTSMVPEEAANLPGFLRGIELRRAPKAGGPEGAFGYWVRLRLPLIAGEETTPLARLSLAGDFANTIGVWVDPRSASTINPDATVQVLRPPVGEWIAVVGETRFDHHIGRGLSTATLSDREGVVGYAATSQLVQPT